jgi:hypothetical protein
MVIIYPSPQVDKASRMIEDIVSRSEEEPSPGSPGAWKAKGHKLVVRS